MRRRGPDFRRQVRRRFPNACWLAFGVFVIVIFFVFFSGDKGEALPRPDVVQRYKRREKVAEGFNATEEMTSPSSVLRQLNDQVSLAKAFLVMAKANNDLQLAWELSAQIHESQILLSKSALRRTPLTTSESDSAIRDMAILLLQAQQLRYDSATMIMKLKATIQGLDEQVNSLKEKSNKYGQIAAEEVPKSLFCLGVSLTSEWFGNSNLERKLRENRQKAPMLKITVCTIFVSSPTMSWQYQLL